MSEVVLLSSRRPTPTKQTPNESSPHGYGCSHRYDRANTNPICSPNARGTRRKPGTVDTVAEPHLAGVSVNLVIAVIWPRLGQIVYPSPAFPDRGRPRRTVDEPRPIEESNNSKEVDEAGEQERAHLQQRDTWVGVAEVTPIRAVRIDPGSGCLFEVPEVEVSRLPSVSRVE